MELQRHYVLDSPPVQCRVKLDVYQVPADGSAPDASKQPAFGLSYISRSGHKEVASNTEGEFSISMKTETIFGDEYSSVDVSISADVTLPDCPNLQIESSISIANNSPVWFARSFNGKQGIDLMVTTTLVLIEGSPFHELIMRQEGDKIKPISTSELYPGSGDIAIGEKHRLIWLATPPDILRMLDNQQGANSEDDPFAAQKPDMGKRSKFKDVKVPNILNPHFYGTVIDIRDALKQNGITIHENDFAGYDPKTHRAFLYSSAVAKIDMFEQLFSFGCCLQVTNLAVTLRGVGEMRLMTRSGQKSWLSSLDSQSKQTRNFEVEPTIGENESIIDLRCNFSEKIGEKTLHSLNTSVTLEAGKFIKISEKTRADGTKEAMEVKAEVFTHGH